MKRIRTILMAVALVWLTACQGTKTNQALYYSTDAVGVLVDNAMKGFSLYEVKQAQAALGTKNADDLMAWVRARPEWHEVQAKHEDFLAAYNAWCAAQAALARGTNVSSALGSSSFSRDLQNAAAALTELVARFTPVETVRYAN